MLNQVGGAKMETMLKLVLILFVSLLSFAVGTFVGKGVSDSEYRTAALEKGDYNGFREPASDEASHGEGKVGSAGLSEEEVNSLTEEFMKDEAAAQADAKTGHDAHATETAHAETKKEETTADGYRKIAGKASGPAHEDKAPAHAAPAPAKTEAHPAPAKAAAAPVSPAAQKVAHNQAPEKDAPKTRQPNSVLPKLAANTVGKFTVQVASYATEEEASRHATDLKGKGFSAFYLPANVNSKKWYRVSVGLFETFNNASTYRSELMKDNKVKTAIVQKIVE